MKRIFLFILTNFAVMAVLLISTRLLGVDRFLTANGLNMTALAGFSLIIGFGGAIISLLMSKTMAKMSAGVRLINQPQNQDEAWIVETVRKFADKAGIGMPEVGIFDADPNAFPTGAVKNAALVAVWSLGIVVFLVFFHAMQQWHPYGFRYFVLVAPWLAVVAAWGLREMPRPAGGLLWGVAGLTMAVMTWSAIFGTYQSGWRAIAQPENARGYFVARQWAAWAQALDRPESAWRVALPDRRPIAAFYRGPAARAVELRPQPGPAVGTAEDLAKAEPGWVIVPAARFIGREGRVLARTWLFEGAEDSPFSLAAYRALGPGELPAPVLYRQRQIHEAAGARWDLLVKVWTDPVVVLRLENPGASAWSYRIDTAAGREPGELPLDHRLHLGALVGEEGREEGRDLLRSDVAAGLEVGQQIGPHLRRGGVAIGRLGGQGAPADLRELARRGGRDVGDVGDLAADQVGEDAGVGAVAPELLAGEQLPEHGAGGEEIGPAVDGLEARLLRRHVRHLAAQHAGPRLARARGRLGDAEVDHLGLPVVGEEEVVRRHVAVDEVEQLPVLPAQLVGGVQALGRVGADAGAQLRRDAHPPLLGPAHHLAQRLAVEVLHGDPVGVVVLAEIEDLGDVRVVDAGRDPRLVEEHVDELIVLDQVRVDALDRDHLREAAGAVDPPQVQLGHAAPAELGEELVAAEAHRVIGPAGQRAHRNLPRVRPVAPERPSVRS